MESRRDRARLAIQTFRNNLMGHKTLTGATQGKIWGHTSCFFENSSCEVHYIEANEGGFALGTNI